ncbi:MAG: hypothetical protein WB817_09500 [Terriglobales bacterium]
MSLAASGIKGQCAALRKKIEDQRRSIAADEEDLRKLEEALEVIERMDVAKRRNGHDLSERLPGPGNVRMKADIFRNAVIAAGRPIKPTEIIPRVPQLARSYVYYLIAELKKTGGLLEDEEGRISFPPNAKPDSNVEIPR